MPRRSNEFQQLVCLSENQLADTATVEESVLLTNVLNQAAVEVDIVIRQTVNGIPICIAIECTARRRPATQEWVREMVGKHLRIPVDKSILVSRSGFARDAITLAEAENMLPLTLEQASNLRWVEFLNQFTNLKLGALTLSPTGVIAQFTPEKDAPRNLEPNPTARVRVLESEFDGTFGQYIEGILRRSDVCESIFRQWLSKPPDQRKTDFEFTLNFTPRDHAEIRTSSDTWRVAESFTVKVRATLANAPLDLTGGSFCGHDIAYGTAENIFSDKERPTQYVLVNLLGRDGMLEKASILFPGTNPDETEIFNMRSPSDPDGKE